MLSEIWILEFSEKQQVFHMNNDNGRTPENTNGWVTISKGDDSYISAFIDYAEQRYKFNKKKPVKLSTVIQAFKSYDIMVSKLKIRFNVERKW